MFSGCENKEELSLSSFDAKNMEKILEELN